MSFGKGDYAIHKDREKTLENVLKVTGRNRKKHKDDPQTVRLQYLTMPESPELEHDEDDLRDPAEFGIEIPAEAPDEAETQETPKAGKKLDAAEEWNAENEIGTVVSVNITNSQPIKTKTRTKAYMNGEEAFILLEGSSNPVKLERLTVVPKKDL